MKVQSNQQQMMWGAIPVYCGFPGNNASEFQPSFDQGQMNAFQNMAFQNMATGQMPYESHWENPAKVTPKASVRGTPQGRGTPQVVPPPQWRGGAPIPMQTPMMQYSLSGALSNGNGYPAMPEEQTQQTHPNQCNESSGGTSAAWRRRQRRRAQGRRAIDEAKTGVPSEKDSLSRVTSASTTASTMSHGPSQNGFSRESSGFQNDGSPHYGEEQEIPAGELLVGDPHILIQNINLANEAIEKLEGGSSREETNALLMWIAPATLDLALSASGSRVMQAAVEVAGGDLRDQMITYMQGHVAELLDSPHGNHVLQKCIEVLPPDTVQFVLDELCAFPERGLALAKHRFGCRILERLLEHCHAEQTSILVGDVIQNAYVLCRHPFGNYVVQHVLEYGTAAQRIAVVDELLNGGVMQLAMHRVASNVIERALAQIPAEVRRALVHDLTADPQGTLTMACSRYGSFIAQRLLQLPASPQRDEVWQQLSAGIPELKASKHGKLLLEIIAPEEVETEPEEGAGTDDS